MLLEFSDINMGISVMKENKSSIAIPVLRFNSVRIIAFLPMHELFLDSITYP